MILTQSYLRFIFYLDISKLIQLSIDTSFYNFPGKKRINTRESQENNQKLLEYILLQLKIVILHQ